ncbi:MAG: ATPase, partial [Chloroflexi bacterium]|nr:ATPase [Chloroflexota bacterium]
MPARRSQTNPFDPMEKALKDLDDHYQALTEHMHSDWTLRQEYPLSRELMALSRVWQSPDGEDLVIAAKGAPEAIIDLCHMTEQQKQGLSEQIGLMAGDGLRVLGVAKGAFRQASLPGNQHEFAFRFLGLVGFADPIRPTVPEAIKECY